MSSKWYAFDKSRGHTDSCTSFYKQCEFKVKRILASKGPESPSSSGYPSVFQTWARNPDDEKRTFTPTLRQITADAFTFHGAGTDTTANTLTVGTWHLINEKDCLKKLQDELRGAIPEPESDPLVSWSTLENLPYLVSCNWFPRKTVAEFKLTDDFVTS